MLQGSDRGAGRDIFEGGRGRRPRFRKLRFLFGGWFAGKIGLAVLVVFLAVAVGAMGYERWYSEDAREVTFVEEDFIHPEAGRDLTADEAGVAARYGRPLYLGDSGLPMVRNLDTGEVRELTPVEVDFPAGVVYDETDGPGVWAPGPRGWGVWWDAGAASLDARRTLALDRRGWVERQNAEIARVLGGLEHAVDLVGEWDRDAWVVGSGTRAARHMSAMWEAYPDAMLGYWGLVPSRWWCDERLEHDLRHGVTFGCPSGEVVGAVEAVWVEVGLFIEMMTEVSELGRLRDELTARQASSLNVDRKIDLSLTDLLAIRERLPAALALLDYRADKEMLRMKHEFVGD